MFFHVRPGHENDLREAVQALQNSPGYRPGDYELPIASIHEARFVLFDSDTRLLFATSFDGPWDAYMEDFAAKPLQLFDAIFRHVEGYEGLPDLAAVKEFILNAQVTAAAYARNYPGTVKEIRKALRVNEAFQRVLDDPKAAEALGHPALQPLLDQAADAERPAAESSKPGGRWAMSHHISGPRAAAQPIADITNLYAFPSPGNPGCLVLVLNTLPFAPPSAVFSDGLIYRFRLRPLTANTGGNGAPFVVDGKEIVLDCVFSTPASRHRAQRPRTRRGMLDADRRDDLDSSER